MAAKSEGLEAMARTMAAVAALSMGPGPTIDGMMKCKISLNVSIGTTIPTIQNSFTMMVLNICRQVPNRGRYLKCLGRKRVFKAYRQGVGNGKRSGATAAEFALVMPLLFTLLIGTLEFGVLLFTYSAMQMAAGNAARRIAVNSANVGAAGTIITQALPGWARPAITWTITQTNVADPGSNVIRVQLTGRSDRLTMMPMLTRMVPWTLVAAASTKQELPYED
jgi:hypothetical protein